MYMSTETFQGSCAPVTYVHMLHVSMRAVTCVHEPRQACEEVIYVSLRPVTHVHEHWNSRGLMRTWYIYVQEPWKVCEGVIHLSLRPITHAHAFWEACEGVMSHLCVWCHKCGSYHTCVCYITYHTCVCHITHVCVTSHMCVYYATRAISET